MNICFVLIEYPVSFVDGRFITDFSGGAGVVMHDIAHGMFLKGHNITVLSRTFDSKHVGSFSDKGIDVHKFYSKDKVLETVNITKFLKKIIKKKNIDIVETCDYAPLIFEMPIDTPLLIRQHTSHGLINMYEGKTSTPYDKNNFDCLIRSFELHLGDSFSGVSNFILERQAQFHGIPKDKIYGVVYNGIKDVEKNELSIKKGLLFCHGTVSKRKGTDKVCQIYNQVKKEIPSSQLKIIGKGKEYWDSSCIKKLSNIAVKDCFYSEYLCHDDVITEISRGGIYISMSMLEAMSISLVEAMRLGKPVILLKNGAFEEFVEDGVEGFLVKNNKEAVSRIIELLNNKDLYSQMSKAAYKKSKLFTIDKCVIETEKWYINVLTNKHEILSKRQTHFNELLKEYYKLTLNKTTKV